MGHTPGLSRGRLRWVARLLGGAATLGAGLTCWGGVPFALVIPKLVAQGITPWLALVGSSATLVGGAARDPLAGGLGMLGAALAVRYIRRATAPHDGFERAFGEGWETRISPEQRAGMLPRRWQPGWAPRPPRALPMPEPVRYGDGMPLEAMVWRPPPGVRASGLGIIYLHGSAWHFADKGFLTDPLFWHLVGQGHVVMKIRYSLAPRSRIDGQVRDVKRAIGWLKANSQRYGVAPDGVVLMGGSAGGHLALLAAYTPHHPAFQPDDGPRDTSVRGVVSYGGLADLRSTFHAWDERFGTLLAPDSLAHRIARRVIEPIYHREGILPPEGRMLPLGQVLPSAVGGTPTEVPELYRLFSPLAHVGPHCPPTLQLQGAHDVGIDRSVRQLHVALLAAGVPSVYVELADSEHAFDVPLSSPAGQAATYDAERFLALLAS